MLGPLMTPFGHRLFVGCDLVGGIGALCELFHLVVAFGCFFFFFSPIPQSGRERVVVGGRSIHS